MYQLPLARFSTFACGIIAACVLAAGALFAVRPDPVPAQTAATVSVLYAGSLVTPMEGPIKSALQARGINFQGEPGGSKKLANFIMAGVRSPDAFISVDPALVASLGSRVASATTFAGTSLGVGWADNSKFAAQLASAAAGKEPLEQALSSPGIVIGRTDPQLDPKGVYTIAGVTIWLGTGGERKLLGDAENPSQIFPEEDLLARIETGQADAGFFYRTEAIARHLHFLPLPGAAALTDKITYTLAVMKKPPHPVEAAAFAAFILTGKGRTILERAGLTYGVR